MIIEQLAFLKKIIVKQQLKHHQKYLEERRYWMIIQLVRHLREDTAKWYVIIDGKEKTPQNQKQVPVGYNDNRNIKIIFKKGGKFCLLWKRWFCKIIQYVNTLSDRKTKKQYKKVYIVYVLLTVKILI